MSKTKVLVIDDNKGITTICRRFLELAGQYVVREENQAQKALESARDFHPELILLDLEMPDKTGDEVARELCTDESLAGTTIALMSGKVGRRSVAGFDALTGLPILHKPIEPAELLERVNALVKARAA